MCKEVIAIIESSRFWELIYPDDTAETRAKRRDHVIDLYLNMQDKIVSLVCGSLTSRQLSLLGRWPVCAWSKILFIKHLVRFHETAM